MLCRSMHMVLRRKCAHSLEKLVLGQLDMPVLEHWQPAPLLLQRELLVVIVCGHRCACIAVCIEGHAKGPRLSFPRPQKGGHELVP